MGLAAPTPHPSRAKKAGAIHLLPQGEKGNGAHEEEGLTFYFCSYIYYLGLVP
jgi:hypothetical protein